MRKYDFKKMLHAKRYPGLIKLLTEDRIRPNSCIFERNLIWNPSIKRKQSGFYTVKGGDVGLVKSNNNYITKENPGFKNWKKYDFQINKNSKITKKIKGFKPIRFDSIGLSKPVGPE